MSRVVSNPLVNVVKAPAVQQISNEPQRVLIVGQQSNTGGYVSGQLVPNILNSSEEIGIAGVDSLFSKMVRDFKAINELTAVDGIVLDDNVTSVKSTGSINVTYTTVGPAESSGLLSISIGSRVTNSYNISVSIDDTTTMIGDYIESAINSDPNSLVIASSNVGIVNLTAKNGGSVSNGIGLEVEGNISGIECTVTEMSGGINDPVLTGVFDVVGETRYQTIIYPGSYDTSELTGFLDPRWNALNSIIDGVGIISKTDTFANLSIFGDANNSQSLVVLGNQPVNDTKYKGSSIFELDDSISAQLGAIRSLRLTKGSNLSQYVTATNNDLVGGTQLASLPYFNTPFLNLPIIDIGKGFESSETKALNLKGLSFLGNNITRTVIISDQILTTYKTDVGGNTDSTYKYLNSVDTHSNIAEYFFNNLRSDYAQYRLTDGALVPGYNLANENTIRSSFVEYYTVLSGEGYLLTRSGRENIKYFSQNIDINLDLVNGKVTSILDVPLVVQLRQLDVILKAVFNVPS